MCIHTHTHIHTRRSQYTITNWEKICKLYPKGLISLLKNDKFRKQRLKEKEKKTKTNTQQKNWQVI